MNYTHFFARRAERYFGRLAADRHRAIDRKMGAICSDPFDPQRSIPLRGDQTGLRRPRVGDLRILFYVNETIEVLEVTEIGPRGDIYKRL